MTMIGELAIPHPVEVSSRTSVDAAARMMAEMGTGDVIVTDPETGAVIGMLTDRDIAVRLVACGRDAVTTEVGTICSDAATTIEATQDLGLAEELMRRDAVDRLPVVDTARRPVGVISVDDLAVSAHVTDEDLRDVLRSLAAAHHEQRASAARP